MNRYSRVIEILEEAVGGRTLMAHGNFWRGKSRDEFVSMSVFGQKLIHPGSGSESNLVKSLQGDMPFGSDVPPSRPGEIFRRMPAALPPIPQAEIDFIVKWIDDGCPEEEMVAADTSRLFIDGNEENREISAAEIKAFFKEFDDYFMFSVSPATSENIGLFFGGVGLWPGLGGAAESWNSHLSQQPVFDAIQRLSKGQITIINRHFSGESRDESLRRAFEQFGAGSLPPNPLRPQEPLHRMDGHTMWNIWMAFASACLIKNVDAPFWSDFSKFIVLGAVYDSLFRDDRPVSAKLHISRYSKGMDGLSNIILRDFENGDSGELEGRLVDISLEALTQTSFVS